MMNKICMWFCQQIADYYFYAGMRLGWNTTKGSNFLDEYNKWIEYKSLFSKSEEKDPLEDRICAHTGEW